jgi:hypothetical protein
MMPRKLSLRVIPYRQLSPYPLPLLRKSGEPISKISV